MMTKTEVAESYRIDERGIVVSPGKFEGEPWYVVALWDLVLDGGGDGEIWDDATPIVIFDLDADMREACGLSIPARDGDDHLLLWERSDGFVCSQSCSAKALRDLKRDMESES